MNNVTYCTETGRGASPANLHPEPFSESRLLKRPLGHTGLQISPLVLGGNVFGWTADKATSINILDRFADAGFETIDTADVYSRWASGNDGGESESIIGEWMAGRGNRDKTIIVTKVGHDMGEGKKSLAAERIIAGAEDSLRRLRTDYIDVYLSHSPDDDVPHEETLHAYQRLLESGKVRAIGASNFDVTQLQTSFDVAQDEKLPRYGVLQPWYNLYDRAMFEGPLRDLCVAENIGVISYYALARGFLSGKYRSEADLSKSPRGGGAQRYLDARGMRVLAALDTVAANHGAEPAEVAIAWVAAQPGISAPIASASSVEQVENLIRSAQIELSAEDIDHLNVASRP